MKRHKGLQKKEVEKRSEQIGLGALKFYMLKHDALKDMLYNPDESIKFEGDTGPYLQYAYARICSILRKSENKINPHINYALLKQKEEIGLIKKLSEFQSVIGQSSKQLRPHLITNYLCSLAQSLSEFYHSCNVLKEREDLKKARLLLIYCVKQVLENGLNLLGIDVLERM
jgi:arginyl-tRNA synthetase